MASNYMINSMLARHCSSNNDIVSRDSAREQNVSVAVEFVRRIEQVCRISYNLKLDKLDKLDKHRRFAP
jgi:hypothetical protein